MGKQVVVAYGVKIMHFVLTCNNLNFPARAFPLSLRTNA